MQAVQPLQTAENLFPSDIHQHVEMPSVSQIRVHEPLLLHINVVRMEIGLVP